MLDETADAEYEIGHTGLIGSKRGSNDGKVYVGAGTSDEFNNIVNDIAI
jgi:hypothetical protein